MIKCPLCGSEKVSTERRPNGNHQCNICHHVWPNKPGKEACDICETKRDELFECETCGKKICDPSFTDCGEAVGYDGEYIYCKDCIKKIEKCNCEECANRDGTCTEESWSYVYDCPDFEEKIYSINDWVIMVHQTAIDKGWHEETPSTPELIALMHSELSEALEEYRNGKEMFYIGENGKTEGIATELADCVIRIMDFCGYHKIDLEHIIKTKNAYNQTRSHRHGGKKI